MSNSWTFDKDHLVVSEVFGPTIQGEGPNAGMPCLFLRLAFCNQHCVWCDTKYSWDWAHHDIAKEAFRYELTEVIRQLEGLNGDPDHAFNLVITGGEPMLQQEAIAELIQLLWYRSGHRLEHVEIETAGTVIPSDDLARVVAAVGGSFNISPKLVNSGNLLNRRRNPPALRKLAFQVDHGGGCFKFVVSSPDDMEEIDYLVRNYRLTHVYLMPEGKDADVLRERMKFVVQEAIKRSWRVSPRLHVEIWGNRRGV